MCCSSRLMVAGESKRLRYCAPFQRAVASSYRALPFEDLARGAVPSGVLQVSPKVDGELWFLVLDEQQAILCSPTGRVVSGDVPVLLEAKAALGRKQGRTVLAGELFAAKAPGQGRPRVGDLGSAMGGIACPAVCVHCTTK